MSDAELILDTDRGAAVVGMRAVGGAPRQLVYRCGAHQLDLLAAAPVAGAAQFLWGQLVATAVCAPCDDAQIELLDHAGSVVAGTRTDEFGEFRIAAAPAAGDVEAATASVALRVDTGDAAFVCRIPPARDVAR